MLNPIRSVGAGDHDLDRPVEGRRSTGVTAAYQAEAAAVTDASPTLAQPTIDCAMGRAFVPVQHRARQRLGDAPAGAGRLISDARDVLDATQFLTGTGTDSPAGVLTGLTDLAAGAGRGDRLPGRR